MPLIQNEDSPYIREHMHFNPSQLSPILSTNSSFLIDNASQTSSQQQEINNTETLKWFFKAVSAVDHSCKATTENLNKLVSFYL